MYQFTADSKSTATGAPLSINQANLPLQDY